MSKKQRPAYYMIGSRYVALNGAARRLFKKKGIDFIDPKNFINLKDIVNKKKGD